MHTTKNKSQNQQVLPFSVEVNDGGEITPVICSNGVDEDAQIFFISSKVRVQTIDGWIPTNAKRAWYHAYQAVCEFRDRFFSDAYLIIRDLSERTQNQRRLAA